MNSRPELKLDWCSHEAAKYACEKWHYSKCIPKSKLVRVGVWEDDRFVGVVLFGVGASRHLVKRYGLKPEQGCELVRVSLATHSAPVTRIVAIALRMLRAHCPGIRLVVSFADPEQGHVGAIYQAGNWVFTGVTVSSTEYIYKGKRWHGRSFRNGHKGMENSPLVTTIKGSAKYRYLMPLDDDMRRQIEPLRQPYPKRERSADSGTTGDQSGRGGASPTRSLHSSRHHA